MIEMVGDFDTGQDALDGEQRAAVCAVVAGILAQCGLDAKDIYFHRELGSPKSCPGHGRRQGAARRRDWRGADGAARGTAGGTGAPRGRASAGAARSARPQLLLRCRSRSSSSSVATSPTRSTQPAARLRGPGGSRRRRVRPGDCRRIGARARRRSLRTMWLRSSAATADEWLELRPHVVNLSEGKLSRTGQFRMDDRSIADIIDGIRSYAESTRLAAPDAARPRRAGRREVALSYARGAYTWWLRHGVYPIYFIWETGAFEVIKNRLGLGRGLGDWWDRALRAVRATARPVRSGTT